MNDKEIAEAVMKKAAEFFVLSTTLLKQSRPEQHESLEKLLAQGAVSAHVAIDIHPIAKISAFARIDGQAYELASVSLEICG